MSIINYQIMYRKDRQKKNLSFPVVLRITIKKKVKYIPLNLDVLVKDWNENSQYKFKKTDPAHFAKNGRLSEALQKVAKIQDDYFHKEITVEEFEKHFLNVGYNSESFYSYIEEIMKRRAGEVSEQTMYFYKKHLSKLKRFRPELRFADVNETFLYAYKSYMINELGNQDITWNKSLEFIRRIINAAVKEGKINRSPFLNVQIRNVKGQTDFLTLEEVKQLSNLYYDNLLPDNQKKVLRYFLFACYTGLRWGDIEKTLKFKNIHQVNDYKIIKFDQSKTKKGVTIPLIKQAVDLLPETKRPEDIVFDTYCNQYTAKQLRAIFKKLQINKKLRFHSARHTCNNLLFSLGVSNEIRAMILGDTEEVVQDFYTKTDVNRLVNAMDIYSNSFDLNHSGL